MNKSAFILIILLCTPFLIQNTTSQQPYYTTIIRLPDYINEVVLSGNFFYLFWYNNSGLVNEISKYSITGEHLWTIEQYPRYFQHALHTNQTGLFLTDIWYEENENQSQSTVDFLNQNMQSTIISSTNYSRIVDLREIDNGYLVLGKDKITDDYAITAYSFNGDVIDSYHVSAIETRLPGSNEICQIGDYYYTAFIGNDDNDTRLITYYHSRFYEKVLPLSNNISSFSNFACLSDGYYPILNNLENQTILSMGQDYILTNSTSNYVGSSLYKNGIAEINNYIAFSVRSYSFQDRFTWEDGEVNLLDRATGEVHNLLSGDLFDFGVWEIMANPYNVFYNYNSQGSGLGHGEIRALSLFTTPWNFPQISNIERTTMFYDEFSDDQTGSLSDYTESTKWRIPVNSIILMYAFSVLLIVNIYRIRRVSN